jgi:hypothetical protein
MEKKWGKSKISKLRVAKVKWTKTNVGETKIFPTFKGGFVFLPVLQ